MLIPRGCVQRAIVAALGVNIGAVYRWCSASAPRSPDSQGLWRSDLRGAAGMGELILIEGLRRLWSSAASARSEARSPQPDRRHGRHAGARLPQPTLATVICAHRRHAPVPRSLDP